MGPDARGMYAEAVQDLGRELSTVGAPSVPRINGILGAEYRRWLEFSSARLEQFGFTFDTF